MKKVLLFVAMVAMIVSCNNKTKNNGNTFTNDLDNVKMWNNPVNVIKGIAHSGNYACKLDTSNIYSFGFNILAGDIFIKAPKKINISLWAYSLTVSPDASIVIEINKNGQQIFWKNAGFLPVTKAKEWIEVKTSFDLPANLDPKSELRIYVWNPKKLDFYIDDFNITFE